MLGGFRVRRNGTVARFVQHTVVRLASEILVVKSSHDPTRVTAPGGAHGCAKTPDSTNPGDP